MQAEAQRYGTVHRLYIVHNATERYPAVTTATLRSVVCLCLSCTIYVLHGSLVVCVCECVCDGRIPRKGAIPKHRPKIYFLFLLFCVLSFRSSFLFDYHLCDACSALCISVWQVILSFFVFVYAFKELHNIRNLFMFISFLLPSLHPLSLSHSLFLRQLCELVRSIFMRSFSILSITHEAESILCINSQHHHHPVVCRAVFSSESHFCAEKRSSLTSENLLLRSTACRCRLSTLNSMNTMRTIYTIAFCES